MSLLARWQVTFTRKCLFLSTVIQNFQENFHIQGMNINVFPGWNCVWICCPRPEAAGRAGFKQFTPYKFKITELSGEICPAPEFRLSQFPHLISVLWGNPRALPIFKVDEMRRCLDAFTLHPVTRLQSYRLLGCDGSGKFCESPQSNLDFSKRRRAKVCGAYSAVAGAP